jgi:hypothetical protein
MTLHIQSELVYSTLIGLRMTSQDQIPHVRFISHTIRYYPTAATAASIARARSSVSAATSPLLLLVSAGVGIVVLVVAGPGSALFSNNCSAATYAPCEEYLGRSVGHVVRIL